MEAENLYMSRERSAAHTQRPSFLPRGGSPKGEAIGLIPDTLHRPRGIIRGRYGHPRARELLPRGPDFLSIVATNTPFLASIFTMTQSRWMGSVLTLTMSSAAVFAYAIPLSRTVLLLIALPLQLRARHYRRFT